MRGWRAVLVASIIGLVILGGYLYANRPKGHPQEVDTSRAQILAYLGGLDCYSYQENVTIAVGNETVESKINGGKIDRTYYFEGQRSGLHWYAAVINNTLRERIMTNGTAKDVNITLSKEEKAMFLSIDPVRIGLQAVGTGKLVKRAENNMTYAFNIAVSPSTSVMMNGTVTLSWDGEKVTRLTFNVDVRTQGGQPERRIITAVIGRECRNPGWLKELLG